VADPGPPVASAVAAEFEPDAADLGRRLSAVAQRWQPGAVVTGLRRLPGGESSLTYLATVDSAPCDRIVVKVAPPGLPATRNRNVLRQAQLLAELHGTPVPVPEVLFTDDGALRHGPMFAMSFCEGDSLEPNIDEAPGPAPPPQELEARARYAARILADLHGRDVRAAWFTAERPVSLSGEIDRWERALSTLPADFGLAWEGMCARLRATEPQPVAACLTHGDFRLGNTLCRGGRVTAVLDWEIWSRGDPRLDLAWFLLSLDGGAHPASVRAAPGIPGTGELIGEYEAARGSAVGSLSWFTALSLLKLTATTGLIAKHALRRGDTSNWGVRMLPRLRRMLADPGRALGEP
jgi:aminoglycoside phosphotransferase (APT) family kinase protein